LAKIPQLNPDAVKLDIEMPGLNELSTAGDQQEIVPSGHFQPSASFRRAHNAEDVT